MRWVGWGMLLAISTALAQVPTVPPAGVVNGASFAQNQPVSPGSLISIFGTALGSSRASASSIPLSTQMADVRVTFNGVAAPLLEIVPQTGFVQINAQMPWSVAPGAVDVVATNGLLSSTPTTIQVAASAPGIFTLNSQGTGQAAVQIFPDNAFAAPAGSVPGVASRPAKAGDVLIIYATGLGAVDHQVADGALPGDLSRVTAQVGVLIGGAAADVQFAGLSPQYVGLNQINAVVPSGVPTGAAVPLQIQMGGTLTSDKVTIAVQ